MEISHASTETQSAALGILGKAEEVKVSADAEFMMAVAHGIYSNKALAIVRELLCNARDGHFAAGTPDAAIIVTLTDNKLVVRDHGTGIPIEKFAPMYMTFGGSSKRQLKNQTGGFGVGSKVPWAVCDVFTARNFHNKKMTTFAIMKSDPAMDGQPSCTPVMTLDSIEPSGVEVTVPFPEKLQSDLRKYIFAFVQELNLHVVLNGTDLKDRGSLNEEDLNKYGFIRLTEHPVTVTQHTPFYVRLGDVIYPVEMQEEFKDAYDLLVALNGTNRHPILFQAQPNSVVPTMSRESLSYTDRTIQTIRDLMKAALQLLADKVDDFAKLISDKLPAAYEVSGDFASQVWSNDMKLTEQLRYLRLNMPDLPHDQRKLLMNNAERWLSTRMPYLETAVTNGKLWREAIHSDIHTRFIQYLKRFTYLDHTRLLEMWRSNSYAMEQALCASAYKEALYWRDQITVNPLINEVYALSNGRDTRYVQSGNMNNFIAFSEMKLDTQKEDFFRHKSHLSEAMYVSKVVLLVPVWKSMMERNMEQCSSLPVIWSNVYARQHGNMVGARIVRLKATAKADEIAALKTKYEARGYTVFDLSQPTRGELAERAELAAERAILREQPLPTLISMISEGISGYHADRVKQRKHLEHLSKNPKFKGEPLYMLLVRGKTLPYNMNSIEDLKRLVKFVGTDIVCVSTKPELAKVIKEGRKSVDEALTNLAKQFFAWPGMFEKMFYRGSMFNKRAEQNKYLTKLLFNRLPPKLTAEEDTILTGLLNLKQVFPDLATYMNMKLRFFGSCAPADHYQKVFSTYAEENFSDVNRALEKAYSKRPSPKRVLARKILKTILNKGPA